MLGLFRSNRCCSWVYGTAVKLLLRNGGISADAFVSCHGCYRLEDLNGHFPLGLNTFRYFSSTVDRGISWETSSPTDLLAKLDTALRENQVGEACELFTNYRKVHGFPDQSLVSRLIIALSYSSNRDWLRKAYELVNMARKKKVNFSHYDCLTRLAMSMARTQVPVPASTLVRIILEKFRNPSLDILGTVFIHMVKSETGSYLASNILVEICEHVLDHRTNSKDLRRLNATKPSTTIFNVVFGSCVRFGHVMKGQKLIDLMARIGAVADANTIVLLARLFEMNGQRDDLIKLEEHINGFSPLLSRHRCIFYDCLLNLHFKFNDIDSAADMMLDLYIGHSTCDGTNIRENGSGKPHHIQVGSGYLNMGFKIKAKHDELAYNFVLEEVNQHGLVLLRDEKVIPSERALAKLICGYVREKRVGKLASFLSYAHRGISSSEKTTLCADVVGACIQLGWLEAAHDMLDNFNTENILINPIVYRMLFNEYRKHKLFGEARVLLEQIRKADMFDKNRLPSCLSEDNVDVLNDLNSSLKKNRLAEFMDAERTIDVRASQLLHDANSSICYFCKSRMMEDAIRTFRKMQEIGVQANVQTFSFLVDGYSSLGKFREITILWGEIKRRLENGMDPDRDLFDCLLWNFLQGGYFERVMDIITLMNHHKMRIDRVRYRSEFLKLHRLLYRSWRASDAITDAQKKRLQHVQAFRRWARIGIKT